MCAYYLFWFRLFIKYSYSGQCNKQRQRKSVFCCFTENKTKALLNCLIPNKRGDNLSCKFPRWVAPFYFEKIIVLTDQSVLTKSGQV